MTTLIHNKKHSLEFISVITLAASPARSYKNAKLNILFSATKEERLISDNLNCKSKNFIYLIE